VIEDARERVALCFRCAAREVVFTSGATEANNQALFGAARALRRLHGEAPLLLSSAAEHPAVLAALRLLQSEGWLLRLLPIDSCARVDAGALLEAANSATSAAIVALQWANNETGAVQEIARLTTHASDRLHVHVDAVQGFGKLPWDETLAAASTFAVSGHKVGAPKGIGALRIADAALMDPLIVGGGQQRGRRAGTESPALAAAFACALELAMAEQEAVAQAQRELSEIFLARLREGGLSFTTNHPPQGLRLPNTLSITLDGVDGRALLPACDAEGLNLASGAACASGAPLPSAVLLACGLSEARARSTVRISLTPTANSVEVAEAATRFLRVARRLYEVANR
jgi:cysteine desulfurase